MAADDASLPILGYSTDARYRAENSNTAFLSWMSSYADAIQFIKKNNLKADQSIQDKWTESYEGKFSSQRGILGVAPLCKAIFNQSPFVNDQTPYDKDEQMRCVTGCPATAMAIIMKKWNHPFQGTGFHSYNHTKYGNVSANFGNSTYDWESVPDTINEANSEIAKIMFHCGVSVDMQYTASSSGAYILIDSPTPMANCEYAYKTYFGYSNNLKGLTRSDFSDDDWIKMLLNELDLGRPMQYAGFGGGGHTFVCDGYDDAFKFHMNWGWGGQENGFFELNSLNPGAGGIGSGEGTYNNDQQAIVGIRPLPGSSSSAPKFGLNLGSDIAIDKSVIVVDSAFSLTVDIKNTGNAAYTTDLAALIFNSDGVFVDYVDSKDGVVFQSGETLNFVFSTAGISTLSSMHTIGIYGSEPKDTIWHLIKQASFINPIDVNLSAGLNDLKIASETQLPATPIFENVNFEVNTSIINTVNQDFNGTLVFDIFDYESNFVKTVYEKAATKIDANTTVPLSFEIDNKGLGEGTYYLVGFSSADNITFTSLSNDLFANPVSFDVLEAPILEDPYESNNNSSSAFNLPISYQSDKAYIATVGSNFHTVDDIDHYRLDFEDGYDYKITAKLIDENSISNMGEYSVDAYFTFDSGSGQSSQIQGDVEREILVSGPGTVRFKVSPFFVGFLGSYQLEMSVERVLKVSTKDNESNFDINVYPNPTSNQLFINGDFDKYELKSISIIDVLGKKVDFKAKNAISTKQIVIDVSSFDAGFYSVILQLNDGIATKKFSVIK